MSCNCKTQKMEDILSTNSPKLSLGSLIGKYTIKIISFILLIALLPLINLVIIWFMFRTLVLNKDVDIKPLLIALGNQFKVKEPDDDIDDEEFEELTEHDVVVTNVEDITNKPKSK